MNFVKLLPGVLTGALFSGIMLAICVGLITMNSTSTGELGLKDKDLWWITSIIGFLLGLMFGGIMSVVIIALHLNLIKSFLFCFICSLCLVLIIAIWLGGDFSDSITYSLVTVVVIESINGLLVSSLFSNSN